MSDNSKALASTRKCSNCMWWDERRFLPGVGRCKGAPPSALNEPHPVAVWPQTMADDWCGSFRMKEPGQ